MRKLGWYVFGIVMLALISWWVISSLAGIMKMIAFAIGLAVIVGAFVYLKRQYQANPLKF